MNYKNIYEILINRAKGRELDCYTESHHIVPRCMGGDNSVSNLVDLTAEEHYVVHQLLVKIYPQEYGLIKASVMMCVNTNGTRPNNKLYGWLRRKHSESTSGENNINFGKPRSAEVKAKISASNIGKGGSKLKGRVKGPMKAETKEKLSNTLKGRPNPNQQGDKNVSKRPAVAKKSGDTRRRTQRKQVRDGIIFKFEHIITGEVVEGTRQQFRSYAKISSQDIAPLINGIQKTSKGWKIFGNIAILMHTPDPTIHVFRNMLTDEEVSGTRVMFRQHSGMSTKEVHILVMRKEREINNWKCLLNTTEG